jgi:hypothetical protein
MRDPIRWALVAGVAISLAWVALTGLLFALGGLDAFGIPSEAGSLAGAWRRLFFAWPDLYEPVALQWATIFPLLTAAFFLAMLWRLVLILDRPLGSLLRDPVIVLLYFVLAVGVIQPLYNSIRYTHFLYPVAFVVLAQALKDWIELAAVRGRTRRAEAGRQGKGSLGRPGILAVSGGLLLLFLASNDFHPSHLLALNEPDVAYRTGRWEGYSRAWYERSDMVSPSRYVRQKAAPSDAVVAVNMPVASYYLERPHLVFVPRDRGWRRYIALARERGTLDVWSGQPLAGTLEELEERIGGARTVWFLDTAPASPELQELLERDHWSGEKMLESRDGRYQVIRARRSDPTRPSGPGGR